MNIHDYFKSTLKSCDVINISSHQKWWEFWLHITYYGIRKAQRDLFKDVKVLNMVNNTMNPTDDTHTCMFFRTEDILTYAKPKITDLIDPKHFGYIFSCEYPEASFFPIDSILKDDIRIYRYNNNGTFDNDDIKIMLEGCLPLVGTKYDIGQLMDIAVNQTAGYPYEYRHKWFDMGEEKKVCSVSIASIFAYWRHRKERQGEYNPRLFEKLNYNKWDKQFVKKFMTHKNVWDIESTYPAMFSCTNTHFDNEFRLILWSKNNKIIYLLNI